MSQKRRYNVRSAPVARASPCVKASLDDVGTFYRCLTATAERQDFEEFSPEYYLELFRIFAAKDQAKLFIAEHTGDPLSALLVVAFGDTALYKRGGWLGRRGDLHPNELMHWTAICWAKQCGYRFYDFEGIKEYAAEAILGNERYDTSSWDPLTKYKLSFGGDVRINPATFAYIPNPVLRFAHDRVYTPMADNKFVSAVVTRLKYLRR